MARRPLILSSAATIHQGGVSIASTSALTSNAKSTRKGALGTITVTTTVVSNNKRLRYATLATAVTVQSATTALAKRIAKPTLTIPASSTLSALGAQGKDVRLTAATSVSVAATRLRRATSSSIQSSTLVGPIADPTIEHGALRYAAVHAQSFVAVNYTFQAKGAASTSIQSTSAVSFGTLAKEYLLNASSDTYTVTVTPRDITWEIKPLQANTSVTRVSTSIQSTSLVRPNVLSQNIIGVSIRQSSRVRAEATRIIGSEEVDKGTGAKQATIYLSSTHRGTATATISGLRWSNFSGIREGFRIVSGAYPYESVAILTEEPQFRSNTVEVRIKTPFSTSTLLPGEWRLDVPEGQNFNAEVYTPNYFRESDIVSAVMKDMRKFVVSDSTYLTERMRDFRKWNKIDPVFLGPLGQTMGMSIRMDRFDDEARRRAVHEWVQFCQYAGTETFIDFEGYVLDTIFTLEHLWTNDYKNFVPRDFATDSSYYPTNHVSLRYDANLYDIYNSEDIRYIHDIFYKLASVPLVLEALFAFSHDDSTVWIQGVGYEQEYAPLETNDLPPNIWVIGVENDIEYIFDKPNELPPNFWIIGADQDIEYIEDFIEIPEIPH